MIGVARKEISLVCFFTNVNYSNTREYLKKICMYWILGEGTFVK